MLGRIASDTIDGEREYFDTNSVFTVNEFGVIKINQTIGFGYYRFFQFTVRLQSAYSVCACVLVEIGLKC